MSRKGTNELQTANNNAVDELAALLLERISTPLKDDITADIKNDISGLEGRMDKFENSVTIESSQQRLIQETVSSRVHDLLDGCSLGDWIRYSRTFYGHLYSELKSRFCVPSYRDIRKVDYDVAVEVIDSWYPSGGVQALKDEIDERLEEE